MSDMAPHLQSLKEALRNYPKIEPYFDQISQSAVPRIGIQLQRLEDTVTLPVAASKFGGSPDTPPGFEWKLYQDKPLAFVAQFRLDELAPFDVDSILPKTGLLSCFCDYSGTVLGTESEEKTAWFVEVFPLEGLVRTLQPEDDDGQIYMDFDECSIAYQIEFDLQDVSYPFLGFSDEHYEEYGNLKYFGSDSHLLGLGHIIGNERGLREETVSLMFGDSEQEAACALVKIGSEWQAGMNWGDADWLQFFIPVSDLSQANFKRVWARVEL
jgi:uncharacterized protein YwqG